jgi:hypothetical protein
MSENTYTIDKVGWHTSTPGNSESKESIELRFRTITEFLNNNNLVIELISVPEKELPDEFEISSEQLNSQGMAFMKKAYDKWLQRIDNGASPDDNSFLLRQLGGNGI